MKKLWKKGSISDKVREYQSYDQLEGLATDYRESVIDELLTYNDAYGFGFYVAAWIAPRLEGWTACNSRLSRCRYPLPYRCGTAHLWYEKPLSGKQAISV